MKKQKVEKDLVLEIINDPKFQEASIKVQIQILNKHIEMLNRGFDSHKKVSWYIQEQILKLTPSDKNNWLIFYIEDNIKRLNSLKDNLMEEQWKETEYERRVKNEGKLRKVKKEVRSAEKR